MIRAIGVVALALFPLTLAAQDEEPGYDSSVLVGIESVRLGPTALVTERVEEATGFSVGSIERRVGSILELEVRRAGLPISPSADVALIYTLDAAMTSAGTVVYTQNLQVWELVDRLRTPRVESDYALTWRYGGMAYWTNPDGFRGAIERGARDMVDSFLIHYLRANPR